MGGFRAALVSFSSALHDHEATPPRAAKRESTPASDLLNGENRVQLPVAPTAHTPEAGEDWASMLPHTNGRHCVPCAHAFS